jgi:hypothetical protein
MSGSKAHPPETKYAIGMARGGAIWWQDGRDWVEVQKRDGPILAISLARDAYTPLRYPKLARRLFTAFYSERTGIPYDEAARQLAERKVDGFWDDLASVLVQTRMKNKGE